MLVDDIALAGGQVRRPMEIGLEGRTDHKPPIVLSNPLVQVKSQKKMENVRIDLNDKDGGPSPAQFLPGHRMDEMLEPLRKPSQAGVRLHAE